VKKKGEKVRMSWLKEGSIEDDHLEHEENHLEELLEAV